MLIYCFYQNRENGKTLNSYQCSLELTVYRVHCGFPKKLSVGTHGESVPAPLGTQSLTTVEKPCGCLEKHPPRESLNASGFPKDKHFGCALGFVFVNPSDSEFPLCKENHCGFSTVCPIFSLSGYVQFQQEARRRLPPVAPDRRPHLLRQPVYWPA